MQIDQLVIFFVCLCSDGHLIFYSMRRLTRHMNWQALWMPGGAGLLRWTEGALRDFSGALPQMARTPNGGSSWARARARAIQCYSMLFFMKCMAVRSYLEVLEFPHWEWGGIHADLFFLWAANMLIWYWKMLIFFGATIGTWLGIWEMKKHSYVASRMII